MQFYYGHIGRFNYQKNHEFLLEIIKAMKKNEYDVKLLLVGNGEKKDKIENDVKALNLEKNVIFVGLRDDIPKILSAMDILLLPSFYEGMPNVVIEAQATGLKCLLSDTITREADITGLVKYLSIESNVKEWCDNIINEYKYERKDERKNLIEHEYDIGTIVDQFIKLVYEESNTNDN